MFKKFASLSLLASIFILVGFFAINIGVAQAADPTQIKVLGSTQTIGAGASSASIQIESQDGGGVLADVTSTSHVNLTSTSPTGQFASSPAGGPCNSDWGITQVTIALGTAHKSFCYKDSAIGTFTLTATDQAGVLTPGTQDINIVDLTPPVITLLGDTTINIQKGYSYTDAGATAVDDVNGDLTSSIVIVNPVNTSVPGTYTVTYDVADTAGNLATQVTRTVNVRDDSSLLTNFVSGTYGDTVSLSATLTDSGGNPLAGKTIDFSLNGHSVGSAITDGSGVATLGGVVLSHANGVDAGFFFASTSPTDVGVKASFASEPVYIGSIGLANLSVAQRDITVTGVTDTKTYDGTDHSSGIPNITSGSLVAGDTSSWTQLYDNRNVGTGKLLTPTGAVNDGNSGNNYHVTFVPDVTGVINRLPITLTVDTLSKNYGEVDPALTYTLSTPLVGGDSFGGAINREPGESLGVYNVTQGSLTLDYNYDLTFVNGTFTINPEPITITANNLTKNYGDSDPTLTYSITSGSLVNPSDISGDMVRDLGESLGSYNINQGTLTANSNYILTFVGGTLIIEPAQQHHSSSGYVLGFGPQTGLVLGTSTDRTSDLLARQKIQKQIVKLRQMIEDLKKKKAEVKNLKVKPVAVEPAPTTTPTDEIIASSTIAETATSTPKKPWWRILW